MDDERNGASTAEEEIWSIVSLLIALVFFAMPILVASLPSIDDRTGYAIVTAILSFPLGVIMSYTSWRFHRNTVRGDEQDNAGEEGEVREER